MASTERLHLRHLRHGGMHALLYCTGVSLHIGERRGAVRSDVVQFVQYYWPLQLIWLCERHQLVSG